MMEVDEEATYIPQHKARLALFFSAMRHFRDELRGKGVIVHYTALDDPDNRGSFAGELRRWTEQTRPGRLIVVQPGDYRVEQILRRSARVLGVPCSERVSWPV
jgi:deoxyribodipyrimidine photolyase-related protein